MLTTFYTFAAIAIIGGACTIYYLYMQNLSNRNRWLKGYRRYYKVSAMVMTIGTSGAMLTTLYGVLKCVVKLL